MSKITLNRALFGLFLILGIMVFLLIINVFIQSKSSSKETSCLTNVSYLYDNYDSYGNLVESELGSITGLEPYMNKNSFGIAEEKRLRNCGKLYFIVYLHGEWDSMWFWAVEVDAETGKLIKWKEVSKGTNEIDYEKIWWIN